MKTRHIARLMAVLAVAGTGTTTATAQSQTNRSSYFLEGATHRHELNPAFMSQRGYVTFPGLGNLSIGAHTSAGVKNFVYDLGNDSLGLFMHPDVDGRDFVNDLPRKVRVGLNLREEILGAAWYAWGGFNTVSISARADVYLGLPRTLFEFMKLGVASETGSHYRIKNIRANAQAFAEIAFGHAREINDQWTVGAKAKVLLPFYSASAKIDQLDVVASQDRWAIHSKGAQMQISGNGLKVPTKGETGNYNDDDYVLGPDGNRTDVLKEGVNDDLSYDDIELDGAGVSGGGLAFDLGATYRLNESWTFSAALLDLGFLHWNSTTEGTMSNDFEFDGFEDIYTKDGDSDNSLENQGDRLADDLADLAKFKRTGTQLKRNTMLGATLNLGAQYTLPMYDRLTFGLLSSTYIKGPESWSEARLSANISPVSWFGASINYALSSFGSTGGLMLSFQPRGFNFFLAADAPLGKLSKGYGVPLHRAALNFNMGINFTFGRCHQRAYKVKEVESL